MNPLATYGGPLPSDEGPFSSFVYKIAAKPLNPSADGFKDLLSESLPCQREGDRVSGGGILCAVGANPKKSLLFLEKEEQRIKRASDFAKNQNEHISACSDAEAIKFVCL